MKALVKSVASLTDPMLVDVFNLRMSLEDKDDTETQDSFHIY